MRFTPFLALAALVTASLSAGVAMAAEPLHLTPPLYREQTRAMQQTRQASDLTTTPNPVAVAKPVGTRRTIDVVAEAMPTR